MNTPIFKIGDVEIQRGQSERLSLDISVLPTRTVVDLPVHVSRGEKDGPVLLLMAGLHGDETNGIEILRRVIREEINKPECGVVITCPLLNVYGFLSSEREVPDGKDINRAFPGNRNGSLASRIAYYFRHYILPQVDFGFDFHTGGANRFNYPQVRCVLHDELNRELANAFAAPFLMHSGHRDKSLRQTAWKLGKRILVYEGGESLRFDEHVIAEGVNGVKRVMNHLGMRNFQVPPAVEPQVLMKSSWVRARTAGLFQPMITAGQQVRRRQVIGYIFSPYGDAEYKVVAPTSGFVVAMNHDPVVHMGDALVHIGVP